MAATSSRRKVAVIGAGVVGLNSALELQRRHPTKFDVTLIADKFNGETLSDGAAGLFRPDTYIFGPDREVSQQWINDSFSFYKNIMNSTAEPCGINPISGYMFSTKNPSSVKNFYMENCSPDYRETTDEELRAISAEKKCVVKYGSYYSTMTIECKLFLPWALKKIIDNGGVIIKRKIESLEELCGEYDIVFNCTGLAARKLCNDLDVIPIRGQVIRVKAPWVDKFYYYDDTETYIIPSKDHGTVVLGGCRHFGSYNDSVDERLTEEILANCVSLVPSLKEALKTDYEVWVGLRPYRNKIRIELERINGTVVVHNYGHGGYGVTLAPGTSKYAVDLLTSINA